MFNTVLLMQDPNPRKKYRMVSFFNQIGLFPDTIGRRHFIFALLDNCSFNRACPKCGILCKDVIQHTLDDCPNSAHTRLLLKYKLTLYNVPANIDITNKRQLFQLGIHGKRIFRKVLCEYLTDIGMY